MTKSSLNRLVPCLTELGAQRLGIVSNGDSRQQREKLRKLGVAGRFSVVFISGDIGFAKQITLPDDELINKMSNKASCYSPTAGL